MILLLFLLGGLSLPNCFFPPSLFDLITIFPAGGSFSQVSGNLYSVLSIKRTKKLLKVLFMVGLAACEFHCRVI